MLSMDRDTMRDLITADHPNAPDAFMDTLTALIADGRTHVRGGDAPERVRSSIISIERRIRRFR
jgi:hypothetical protein